MKKFIAIIFVTILLPFVVLEVFVRELYRAFYNFQFINQVKYSVRDLYSKANCS